MTTMALPKKTFRISALLLVVCMISTVMLSGTFARYASEYSGQDTALVARWSFTGNFDNAALTGTNIDLPIWDHDYTTNIFEKTAGGDYLIAPGIKGSFAVEFSYDADVNADLTFKFTKSGFASTKVPIQYSLDDFAEPTNTFYSLHDLEDAIVKPGTTPGVTGSDGVYVITDTAASIGGTATDEAVGTGNGTTTIFNLDQTPTTGTLTVKVDGNLVDAADYTVLGSTITFDTAPSDTDLISASYTYDHTAIHISETVYWRWPLDPADHNIAGAAAKRVTAVTDGELVSAGTGLGDTWTNADDTALGLASGNAVLGRDDYTLNLEIKAIQIAPAP